MLKRLLVMIKPNEYEVKMYSIGNVISVACLPVTVSEDEVWQRDAAAGERPVSCGHSKTSTHLILFLAVLQ